MGRNGLLRLGVWLWVSKGPSKLLIALMGLLTSHQWSHGIRAGRESQRYGFAYCHSCECWHVEPRKRLISTCMHSRTSTTWLVVAFEVQPLNECGIRRR